MMPPARNPERRGRLIGSKLVDLHGDAASNLVSTTERMKVFNTPWAHCFVIPLVRNDVHHQAVRFRKNRSETVSLLLGDSIPLGRDGRDGADNTPIGGDDIDRLIVSSQEDDPVDVRLEKVLTTRDGYPGPSQ